MIPKELNDWLQVVGLFGVLGGLIFVGLQVRQERQVAQTETIYQANDTRMYWAELITSNSDVWVKGLAGETLSPTEEAEFNAMAVAWELTQYSSWYSNVLLSQQPPERFAKGTALELYTYPGLLAFWRRLVERDIRIDPTAATDPWFISVNAEIDRLEKEGE